MITELKALITAANPAYTMEYEEMRMMNVTMDQKATGAKVAYIEEYYGGEYVTENYQDYRVTKLQIYFCRFTNGTTAEQRRAIKEEIESEMVLPFWKQLKNSNDFAKVQRIPFDTRPRGWDADLVNILVEISVKQKVCVADYVAPVIPDPA